MDAKSYQLHLHMLLCTIQLLHKKTIENIYYLLSCFKLFVTLSPNCIQQKQKSINKHTNKYLFKNKKAYKQITQIYSRKKLSISPTKIQDIIDLLVALRASIWQKDKTFRFWFLHTFFGQRLTDIKGYPRKKEQNNPQNIKLKDWKQVLSNYKKFFSWQYDGVHLYWHCLSFKGLWFTHLCGFQFDSHQNLRTHKGKWPRKIYSGGNNNHTFKTYICQYNVYESNNTQI